MWCHFDTCVEFNHESARRLAISISRLFKIQSKSFQRMRAPRQTNAYDCGIYVMAMMEYFAKRTPGGTMLETLTEDYIRKFRRAFADNIRKGYFLKETQPKECSEIRVGM
jgi:Ulp1 family protease